MTRRGRAAAAARRPAAPEPEPRAHPGAALWVAVALGFVSVLLSVTFVLFETDVWQHLVVGKAIAQLGRVPTTQLWSWASYGDPEINSAWLFRVLIWWTWSLGEVWGLFVWRWATTLAAFGLLWATARALGARGFAAVLALVVCGLVFRARSQIRPETLVAVYLALELWILETRRQGGPDRTAWIPLIALAWANTHLSWFLGPLLLGIHALAGLVPRPGASGPGARPGRLLWVGAASVAASFLNPFGGRALWQPFDFALHWRNEPMFQAIGELQRLPLAALRWDGVAAVLLGWPLLMLWRARRRGWDVVELVTFVIFAGFAWSSLRFLGYLSLVALPYLARDLDAWAAARRWPAWTAPPWRRAAGVAAACLALGLPVWRAHPYGLGIGIATRYVPERACDFMAEHGVRGRGFNHFHVGGYQLWRFWPDRERLPFATIHPEALRREDRLAYNAAFTDPEGWRALDRRHHFEYALLYRRQLADDRLLDFLDADPGWSLVFLDDVGALYVRRDGPLAGVAERFGYHAAPAGKRAIAALGRACERDSALRSRARFELERQADASPENAMASSLLATIALMDGRTGDAEARLRRSLAVDPKVPRAHERLGLIALAAGHPRDAVHELERALRERPVASGVHFHLGRAWQALGDPARARTEYRAELARDPGHAPAREALRALDERAER